MVVLKRNQLEKLSKGKLIDKLLTVNSVLEDLANITSYYNEFLEKHARVQSELEVSKNCAKLVSKQIEVLQRNTSQYLLREMIEINPVPEYVQDKQLEETMCKALSLAGTAVNLPQFVILIHEKLHGIELPFFEIIFYVTWFHERPNWRLYKQVLFFKCNCLFETIA